VSKDSKQQLEDMLASRTSELEREIEARRLAEDALAASEARYRSIVETAAEGVWTIDADARTSFVNPKMAQLLGHTPDEMRGRRLLDFTDDEGRALAAKLLARREGGIAESHEFRFVRKDGSSLWAELAATPIRDARGAYTGAVAMVRDVTERRRAEELLRATEERFRSLFEHSPAVLWEEDLSDVRRYVDELRASGVADLRAHLRAHPEAMGRALSLVKVLDVNQAAVRMYESGTKEALMGGLARILTPESLAVLVDLLGSLTEGNTLFESEGSDQTFTGKRNHVLIKFIVAPGCEATWSRVYFSAVDITAVKRLEEQLRQSQKMEAIGRLAGGVAHDFNNLLTVIRGNTTLLQAGDLPDELRGDPLVEIAQATDRAATLTRQLLAFSRKQRLQRRPLDLNHVVSHLAKMLERVLGEDVRLELELAPRPLVTRADAGMLDQVLMNLVVNARDAMPDGGRLVVSTAPAELSADDRRRFPDARAGAHVEVRVTDTGCGIPAELMAHIFEPFFTTKQSGQGTGLGLATVFGIVEQHGGALRVTSEPGGGTTVAVLLPASDGDADLADVAASREPRPEPRGGSESILLVEDEEAVRRLTQRTLEQRGYSVRIANTGAEALRLWQDGQSGFDLVLTDMVMPGGVSGRELAERLCEQRPGLKVIYMSGYAGDVAGPGIQLREGWNFLQKPFGSSSLLECVRARLDGE
jgi:PAS domain S-box-containing protein